MSIPIDLGSLVIGAIAGAAIYWLATHVSEWLDALEE